MSLAVHKWLISIAGVLLITLSCQAKAASIEQQRTWYKQAREALRLDNHNVFMKYRSKLDDYPLTPYLDYNYRRDNISKLSRQQAIEVLAELADTPLYLQFKSHYLHNRGESQNWQDFLAVSPELPRAEALQCYFHRAQLGTGQQQQGYEGAQRMWRYGKSRHKACDPLFKAWTDAGKRSQRDIFERMLLTYDTRQFSLMRYLNRSLTGQHRKLGDQLIKLYRDPSLLRYRSNMVSTELGQKMVTSVLKKHGRTHVEKAWRQWLRWQPHLPLEANQTVARSLLYRALVDDVWKDHYAQALKTYGTDKLKQQRIRQTIFTADWSNTDLWLRQLSSDAANKSEWLFWRGYVAQQLMGTDAALALWQPLSQRRNFYGFLAAQRLGKQYVMQNQLPSFTGDDQQAVSQHNGYLRIRELMALDKLHDAKQEMLWLLKRLPRAQQAALIATAHDKQWHFLSIAGTIQTKMWDALAWRFPTAYGDHFLQFAELRRLDMTLLQALARRESALYPQARSGANAHGLMQLLPTTAKATAKKIGAPYNNVKDLYQPKRNIQLGSAYYRQLYQQYDQNRLLASAAYNAGPHRVKKWLARSEGKLSATQFIATIPFKETREYVEAILSYQLIYANLDQRNPPLMTDNERQRRY